MNNIIITKPVAEWILNKFFDQNCIDHSEGFTYNTSNIPSNNIIIKNSFLNICLLILNKNIRFRDDYLMFSISTEFEQTYHTELTQSDSSLINSIEENTYDLDNINKIYYLCFIDLLFKQITFQNNGDYFYKHCNTIIRSDIGEHLINNQIILQDTNYVLNKLGFATNGNSINSFQFKSLDCIYNSFTLSKIMRTKPTLMISDKLLKHLKLSIDSDYIIYN
ncbi:hypothetical protein PBI_SCTP2_117 [Salicola phage SCTP-2]|nr:hypothetical protein PBI_SCTP2_117 [Salicola phage SCTP-2]